MNSPRESPRKSGAFWEEATERELLVGACEFSPEQVARIDRAAAQLGVSFAAAAIDLGMATSREVELILRTALRQPVPSDHAVVLHPNARRTGNSLTPVPRLDPLASPAYELLDLLRPGNARTDELRALRTEVLMRVGSRDGGIAIAVMSTTRGDGRTRMAAELALSLAQLNRNVLLIDADMRNPGMHRLIQLPGETIGLAHSLGDDMAPDAFGVQGFPTLSYIPGGEQIATSLELLSDHRFKDCIDGCCEQYDFVVIDTPPSGLYADGLAIASAAGHALMVLRAAKTTTREAQTILNKLAVAGVRVVGAVLNHN
jgi:capsular exopolysaccharide synthesis family protein